VGLARAPLLTDFKEAAPEAMVVGVDRAEGMLRVAQRSGHQLCGDGCPRLGIRSDTIDVAVLIFVLFHLPQPSLGLREACRVLREGGTVGMLTWDRIQGLRDCRFGGRNWTGRGRPGTRGSERHATSAMDTPEKIQRLLEAVGFVPVNVWSSTWFTNGHWMISCSCT